MKRTRDEQAEAEADAADELVLRKLQQGDGEDEEEEEEEEEVDPRKLVLALERAANRNLEARSQHRDPTAWIESEVALDEAVGALAQLEADGYAALVQLGGHATLVQLLDHANADVGAAALRTAAELLEDQGEDGAQRLCEALAGELAEAGAVPGALAVWRRLADEGEPGGEGARAAVAALERFCALDGETGETLALRPGFVELCARALAGPDSETALAAGELLGAALVRGREALAEAAAQHEGEPSKEQRTAMEMLLQVMHRRGRGKTEARDGPGREALGAAAEAVAALAGTGGGWTAAWLELDGPELAASLVTAGGAGLPGGLRALAWAGQEDGATCERVVEAGVLGPLLGWLSRNAWPKKLARRHDWGPSEWSTLLEQGIALLHACCSRLEPESMPQLRVWHALDAQDGAGLKRLVELWAQYRDALAARNLLPNENEKDNVDDADDDNDGAEQRLLDRIECGWTQLTQLSEMLVWLTCLPTPLRDSLRSHLARAASKHSLTWSELAAILKLNAELTGYSLLPALEELRVYLADKK